MAARLSGHVSRCVFSFVEFYQKVQFNLNQVVMPDEDQMDEIAKGMARIASRYHIPLQTCATKQDFSKYGILSPGCITLDIIAKSNGLKFRDLKHTGMRPNCHCIPSHDIGAYNCCPNGCLYCYANQSPSSALENFSNHDPDSPLLIGHLTDRDIVSPSKQKSFLEPPHLQMNLF